MNSLLASALSVLIGLTFAAVTFAQDAPATPSAPATPTVPSTPSSPSAAGDKMTRDMGKKDDTARAKKHKKQKHKRVKKPVQQ